MNRARFLQLMLLAPLGARQAVAATGSPDLSLRYLLGRQSDDGAWRSTSYGAFRDGRALTPHVLRCLGRFADPSLDAAKERAAGWLLNQGAELFDTFPIHNASAILESVSRMPFLTPLREAAVKRLLSLQTGSGGWSYSPLPVTPGTPAAPMRQPNLSATAIAIDGLRAARGEEKAVVRALPFVRGCQNHGTGEGDFDDGGFFQMPVDPARNKAGRAGTDARGVVRFRSYAAATADGLRCLLSAGLPTDDPAVAAASRWLDRFRWDPGAAPADLAYYAARGISVTSTLDGGVTGAAGFVRSRVGDTRREDGSWLNPAGEMRENCPLVATALALEACGTEVR